MVFISMCVREHGRCSARWDYQGKPGQAVLTANLALQLALGGWASAAATDVTDVLLSRKSTCQTETLKVETCTFVLLSFGSSHGAVIALAFLEESCLLSRCEN